jgi:hypothetical protein
MELAPFHASELQKVFHCFLFLAPMQLGHLVCARNRHFLAAQSPPLWLLKDF